MSIIISYCKILPGNVSLNGEEYYMSSCKPFIMNNFFSSVYEHVGIDYRKFYKMDALSKVGFLASELLLKGIDREEPKQDMGIIFFNKSSSLEADMKYQKTIQDSENYFPSPADFVYTLPNIVMGEIAVRNKIYGETVFYVMSDFSPKYISEMIDNTLNHSGLKCVLTGWVEVDINNTLNCMMLLCARQLSDFPTGFEHVYTDKIRRLDESALNELFNY